MVIPFSFPNLFEDIKILVRKFIMERNGDEFEKLVEIQNIFQKIEERKVFNASKNYLITELYDQMMSELSEKAERKKKGLLLGYATGFPLLDKYTEGIQKGTLMRLNAYSNIGKSRFSYQIVNNLIKQKQALKSRVFIFSL